MSGAVADFVARFMPATRPCSLSGHGWSDGAHNYLVGVDVPGRANQERLTRLSLPLRNGVDGVLDDFQRKNAGMKVAIIDACRDDPFQPPPGERGYALARGLKPQSDEGSFIIYSAGEGQTAMDRLSEADSEPNSVFTRTFLPLLRTDLPLRDAIKASKQKTHALADAAGHGQTPAYYDEVLGEACLSAACKTSAVPAPAVTPLPVASPSPPVASPPASTQIADQGRAAAQYNLGVIYQNGQGVAQDYSQARAWYQKAADQGYAAAQENLGAIYYFGRGVAQDYSQARAWYQKAADQGRAASQYNLGVIYQKGQGVAQDYSQARAWYQKAADQGDAARNTPSAISTTLATASHRITAKREPGTRKPPIRVTPPRNTTWA